MKSISLVQKLHFTHFFYVLCNWKIFHLHSLYHTSAKFEDFLCLISLSMKDAIRIMNNVEV